MKACKHYESLIGRSAQHNPAVDAARPFTFPTVPMIYQEQPKQPNGTPILPHRFAVAGRASPPCSEDPLGGYLVS